MHRTADDGASGMVPATPATYAGGGQMVLSTAAATPGLAGDARVPNFAGSGTPVPSSGIAVAAKEESDDDADANEDPFFA